MYSWSRNWLEGLQGGGRHETQDRLTCSRLVPGMCCSQDVSAPPGLPLPRPSTAHSLPCVPRASPGGPKAQGRRLTRAGALQASGRSVWTAWCSRRSSRPMTALHARCSSTGGLPFRPQHRQDLPDQPAGRVPGGAPAVRSPRGIVSTFNMHQQSCKVALPSVHLRPTARRRPPASRSPTPGSFSPGRPGFLQGSRNCRR